MWNFDLLEGAAKTGRPLVLKRGIGATTLEWLCTAERLQSYGASRVILCERGTASHEWPSRNAIDICTLSFLINESPIDVWIDVSHSSGDRVVAIGLLRVARRLGTNGVMVEVHPDPNRALSDAEQAITCQDLVETWG
jgi:3-deoxy-7-phosphoheptulonate synthase/chorismate mutase